jgi:hypothetical protein
MLLWVYIHTGRAWKICPATVGIEPTTFGILAQLDPHRASLKNMPGHGGHIFQARPVWIYTQSNITNIIFTWVHNTSTEKKQKHRLYHRCLFVFKCLNNHTSHGFELLANREIHNYNTRYKDNLRPPKVQLDTVKELGKACKDSLIRP